MADEKLYSQQIGAAYWFVTHKQMLKSILTIFLIVVIVLVLAFNLYLLIFNFGIYGTGYNNFLRSLVTTPPEYASLRQAKLPLAISVSQLSTLPNSQGYDIIAEITNPNSQWYSTFNYQFQINDQLTQPKPGFILPGQSKKLIDLSVDNGNLAGNIVFTNQKWQKEINFPAIEADKLNLETKNVTFIPAGPLGAGEKLPISRVKFDLVNNSAFNYADVALQIYLLSSGQLVAINQIYSGPIRAGESKTYEVNFLQVLPKITDISIVPEINILDPNAFLKF